MVVDDVDPGDGADLAFAGRARQGQVALDAVFDGSRVERLAILEFDPLAQPHDQGLVVINPLPRGGELRDDVEFGADIDKLAAERRKNDAAGKGARHRRIEDIGIVGEADAQCLLCSGLAGSRQHQAKASEEQLPARHFRPLI
jgi:hypothetical protein